MLVGIHNLDREALSDMLCWIKFLLLEIYSDSLDNAEVLTSIDSCLQARNFVHYMARVFAGLAVAFASVWQLTLLTVAFVPLFALTSGAYAVIMIGLRSQSQEEYSKVEEIAEEVWKQSEISKYASFSIYLKRGKSIASLSALIAENSHYFQ